MRDIVVPVDTKGAAKSYNFILAFVKSCSDIDRLSKSLAVKLVDDGVFWFAYPKKSSKKYASDISRDEV